MRSPRCRSLLEACDVSGHVAVGRDDDGRRPAHHMIAGEQGIAVSEAQMVGRVPRRRNRDDRLAVDLERLAVLKLAVGPIVAVERRIGARADRFQRQGSTADDRRACPLGQRPRRRAVIAVGVGAHDRGDRPAADRGLQRVEMLGQVRAGVDQRDFVRPEHIGLGPEVSERGRIVGEHAGDARLQLLQLGIRRVHLSAPATARAVLPAALWPGPDQRRPGNRRRRVDPLGAAGKRGRVNAAEQIVHAVLPAELERMRPRAFAHGAAIAVPYREDVGRHRGRSRRPGRAGRCRRFTRSSIAPAATPTTGARRPALR